MGERHEAEQLVSEGLIDVGAAQKIVGLSRGTLYAAMERGELVYCKFGRARRIPLIALTQWMARHIVSRDGDSAEGLHGEGAAGAR